MVKTDRKVLMTTTEAANAGSWRYFSVRMKFTTAAGKVP
jgi:hypothetical protein